MENPDGRPAEGLGLGKPLGMLAYILVKREVRREELISLFWSDLPEQKARNAFRQTLHRLRKALGDALVSRGTASLAIDTASLDVDLSKFEQGLQRGEFESVLALYRGAFLEGLELGEPDFDNWVIGERSRLAARYQWALEQAITSATTAGETDKALARAETLAQSAPLAAGAALTEAALLIAAGRTSEARANLEQFSQRYRAEYGEEAPREISETLGRLRKDSTSQTASALDAERRVLIGREKEMARLLAIWTDTRAGNGNLVLVEGPDGIGKTAIVEEFMSRISKIGPVLPLVGRERSSGALLPYASIGQALRGVLTAPGLAGASQHLLAEAARLLPELHDQFDLPVVQNVEDEASQLRFYEGIAALLDAVAYEQPVCLVLDDFHSAAPTTIQLVEYLCGRLASVAVAIVIVFRSSSVPAAKAGSFPFGLRESGAGDYGFSIPITRVSVPPLNPSESEALARSVADDDVLPADECQRIAALAGGVPFRILDLARQAAGGLQISALPATLQESLWARLQGCSPAQQRLFVASALIERPASIKLLAGASHLSEAAAFDAVLALETRGLLRQTSQGVAPEHHEAAQFALKGTGPAGRALLAGWAAEAVANESGARPGELAHLFSLAGNSRECLKYSLAAAYEASGLREELSAKHFLALAETAASTPGDRAKIEGVRRALKPETHRLLSGETVAISDADLRVPGARTAEVEISAAPVIPASVRLLLKTLMRSSPVRVVSAISLGVVLALAGLSANRSRGMKGPTLPDSLFLVDRSARVPQLFFMSGQIVPGKAVPQAYANTKTPTWKDSLALPYMNAVESPSGSLVAIERMRESGPDILFFSPAGRQIREAASGEGDDIIAGWSPDGKWLLATHGQSIADGSYDADLFAINATENRRLAVDTSTSRSVVEAAWSPDGTHIAWTARVGETHQQEVFVANADGTGRVNISKSPEEDYHVAWAPDGARLVFTSNRFGNADIFVSDLSTQRLLRLTVDTGQDDYAVFSPDGNFLAFESTAEGISSVFVVRSYGGSPVRVAGGDRSFTVARWGNASPANYIANVRIAGPREIPVGRAVLESIDAANIRNARLAPPLVTWTNLDPALMSVTLEPAGDETRNASATFIGMKEGLARVAISAGGWRVDTAMFRVGNSRIDLLSDEFNSGLTRSRWIAVGDSAPAVINFAGGNGLSPKSGRQMETGVLSQTRLPLYAGFFARATVRAPFNAPTAQRSFTISLVGADSNATMTQSRLQNRLATIQWIGQAARIAYSVDRETWTEPVGELAMNDQHVFEILVDEQGKVAFSIDGALRWKSRLRIPVGSPPSRLWLGSQGAGNLVSFASVHAGLGALTPVR